MKKVLSVILLSFLALSLISCSGRAEKEPGKYYYEELAGMSAQELYAVFTENGMTVPDALKKGKSESDIADMVKSMFPEIVRGFGVYGWSVPMNFISATHKVYESIIIRTSPASGKSYESVKDGFGGKSSLSFYDDGTGYYYSGPLSSYIANGTWKADGDKVTLTVDGGEYEEDRDLCFRISGKSVFFTSEGSDGEIAFSDYLHDNDEFVEVRLFADFDGESEIEEDTGDSIAVLPTSSSTRYVYEGEGAGGDFTISIDNNGSFEYYDGALSSYFGTGSWSLNDGVITLHETRGGGRETVNLFRFEDERLIFISAGSDNFIYVTLEDGAVFNAG